MKKGFTIVELLIYMGLMSAFLVVMGNVLFSVLDLQLESAASSDVQQDGQYILTRIGYDAHRASEVMIPTASGESGNSLELVTDTGNYTYSMDNGDLILTTGGTGQKLNSSGSEIADFTVTRLGSGTGRPSLVVSFTLNSRGVTLRETSETKSYEEAYSLR